MTDVSEAHEELQDQILSAWNDDWRVHVERIQRDTDLSASDALMFLLVMRIDSVTKWWHQYLQSVREHLEEMREMSRDMKEQLDKELGDEEWKQE